MNQRTMLLIAAGITAFMLVLVGGLTAYVSQIAATPATAAAPAAPTATADTAQSLLEQNAAQGSAAEVQALYGQLEQARKQMEEANSRLSKAYDDLAAQKSAAPSSGQAGTVSADTTGTDSPGAGTANPGTISPDRAAAIGAAVEPGATLLRSPELVDFKGTVAYELQYDRGLMYIDATTGTVLDNATVKPAPAPSFVQVGGDDEHESEQHEDDGDD